MMRTDRPLVAVALVLALAAVLRFAGLDRQLWLDEIDALVLSQRRPAPAIVSDWPPGVLGQSGAAHVFYDLLAHVSLAVFGERPFAVRLPAAIFGVLGVGGLFGLVRARFSGREALVSAFLLAVSVPHLFQSQNARGYTALFALAILASGLLLRMRGRERVPWALLTAYVVSVALAAWSAPFGVFLLAGHVLAVAAHRWSRGGPGESWPMPAMALAFGAAAVLIVLAYAPLIGRTVAVAAEQGRLPTPGAGAFYRLGVVRTGLVGLAEAAGGPVVMALLLLAALGGLGRWWARDWPSLCVLGLPVVAQAVVLLSLDVPLNPRYFVLALAILIVSLGLGLDALASSIDRRWPKAAVVTRPGLLGIVLLASVPALVRYYRVPKQDFLGAIAEARARAGPGDRLVAVHHAGRVLQGYYRAGFEEVTTLEQLERVEALGRRVLLLTTLERFLAVQAPDLHRHIRFEYRPLVTKDATVAGAEMILYERPASGGGSLSHP